MEPYKIQFFAAGALPGGARGNEYVPLLLVSVVHGLAFATLRGVFAVRAWNRGASALRPVARSRCSRR